MPSFARRIIAWQRKHGRHDLPWQGADAYRVWLSEIMLQQTQVVTVVPYYLRFIESFPDIAALAAASEEEVLAHWSGLGYYSRARNLHRAARLIAEQHDGKFPHEFDNIVALPGIGRSTAAAISALAFHEPCAILDGNVKRVLARHCGIEGYPGDKKVEAQMWQLAESLLPERDAAIYTQGLMDLGATLCTRGKPRCAECPLRSGCTALREDKVAQLPAPRPKKALPERHAAFLLQLHGNDILLERRPAAGIWGGLWCLPQLEGTHPPGAQALPAFIHTFTHFKLHITPLLLRLPHKPAQAEEPGRVWLDVSDAMRAAIPSPVRRLLLELQQ